MLDVLWQLASGLHTGKSGNAGIWQGDVEREAAAGQYSGSRTVGDEQTLLPFALLFGQTEVQHFRTDCRRCSGSERYDTHHTRWVKELVMCLLAKSHDPRALLLSIRWAPERDVWD